MIVTMLLSERHVRNFVNFQENMKDPFSTVLFIY